MALWKIECQINPLVKYHQNQKTTDFRCQWIRCSTVCTWFR